MRRIQMGRIHIPLGEITIAAALVFALWTVALAAMCFDPAQANAAELPKMLPYGQTHGGRVRTDVTLFVIPSASAAPVTVQTPSCTPFAPTIKAGDALVIRDWTISGWTCAALPEFGLMSVPDGVETSVDVSFDQPPNSFSFHSGAIGAIDLDHASTVGPVANDAIDQTILTLFPTTATPVTVYWTPNGHAEESCVAAPPVTQCHAAQTFAGALRVYLKVPLCGVGPVDLCPKAPAPVYGFVTSGNRNGFANLKAYPF